jgi:hypothetical protein
VEVEEKALGTSVECPRCHETFQAVPVAAESVALEPVVASGPAVQTQASGTIGSFAPGTDGARLSNRAGGHDPEVAYEREEKMRPLSLERVPWAWVDRIMPARPRPFILAVVGIAVGCWLVGLLLAPDKMGFLHSHEWQIQPLFLATHFVCLRLFVTCYTRNFLAGASRMDLPPGEAVRRIKQILGPLGGAAAILIALPFCIRDLLWTLPGAAFAEEAAEWGAAGRAPVSLFLWFIWSAEWFLNAYIWVLLLGFLALTVRTLWYHSFRASIEVMLHEKHYRPFLMMSAQGASIVLFFGMINGFYVWYAQAELFDYIGLGITVGLLFLGFGPPWLQLKSNVERAVNKEMFRLQEKLVAAMRRQEALGQEIREVTVADLAERLDNALAILRSSYLDRMHTELGRAEGKAMLLKLLAPASTIGWKVLRTMFLPG